jgi:hypothetical protein
MRGWGGDAVFLIGVDGEEEGDAVIGGDSGEADEEGCGGWGVERLVMGRGR